LIVLSFGYCFFFKLHVAISDICEEPGFLLLGVRILLAITEVADTTQEIPCIATRQTYGKTKPDCTMYITSCKYATDCGTLYTYLILKAENPITKPKVAKAT